MTQGTRPDLAYEVVELSSKFDKAVVSDLIRANNNLLKLKQLKSLIRFPNLGSSKDWKIVVFSDASHANIDSFSSVRGHYSDNRMQKEECPNCTVKFKGKTCRKVHTDC